MTVVYGAMEHFCRGEELGIRNTGEILAMLQGAHHFFNSTRFQFYMFNLNYRRALIEKSTVE